MTLSVPRYLRIPGIQNPAIHFLWDDWNVEQTDMPIDDSLRTELQGISHRAVAALTISLAEWIVYRFSPLSSDPVPDLRLEAAWAQLIDPRYSNLEDIHLEEWRGPIRGPIGIALRRVVFALEQAWKGQDPVWRACRASKLAEHVLPDANAFRNWREESTSRLRKLYPFRTDEMLGEVVPRQVMDTNFAFDLNQTENLVNRFLSSLDHTSNQFLNAPSVMLESGFVGTPYIFSEEADRKMRYEW